MSVQYMYSCPLWKNAFNPDVDMEYNKEKQRLQVALDSFRKNCEVLAAHIAHDFPEFTVHDITHIDSLWEIASLITGENYPLNPAEAFVLGGAILIHDLGMAAAAYVEGVESLYLEDEWRDIVSLLIRNLFGRIPTKDEIDNAPEDIKQIALDTRLRQLHASKAEQLPFVVWKDNDGNGYRLLDDHELLDHCGETIGLVAASHWWSVEEVEEKLSYVLGAPPLCPYEWEVDALKLACILRCADIGHIDSRRAPSFLRIIRRPRGESEIHWKFQEKIARPVVRDDLLVYSSRLRFTDQDASAWWLAYEAVKAIDREIKQSNQLLREKEAQAFVVQGVKGADHPAKLSEFIHVSNWKPVDTTIHISDVPKLVRKLGGDALYGKKPYVALRELLQNSRDAVVARRKLHQKGDDWGSITIKINKDQEGQLWLSVSDEGIGMTERAIRENLLDFGKSYWGSPAMLEEQPGLMSTDFSSTGKYGIGFYSVFMLGNNVEVFTRSIYRGPDGTLLLKFGNELSSRPILLNVNRNQQRIEPGTEIKICLKDPNIIKDMALRLSYLKLVNDLEYDELLALLCRLLAPTLDVDLYIQAFEGPKRLIIKANDWLVMNEIDLILRTKGLVREICPPNLLEFVTEKAPLIRKITNKEGKVVGRLGVLGYNYFSMARKGIDTDLNCPITCGGFRSSHLNMITGLVLGEVTDATRNSAIPQITLDEISMWATEQAHLLNELCRSESMDDLLESSSLISDLGGETGPLPICEINKGKLTYQEITRLAWPDQIAVLSLYEKKNLVDLHYLDPSVVLVGFSGMSVTTDHIEWPIDRSGPQYSYRKPEHRIFEAICLAKGIVFESILNSKGDIISETKEWIVGTTKDGTPIRFLCKVTDLQTLDIVTAADSMLGSL